MQRELIRGEHARATFSIGAQVRLKEAMDQQGPARHVNGLGRKIATIHPELAARLRVRDTASVGHDPLCDPDYMRMLLKHNPFLRVQTAPEKLTIRVDGFRDDKTPGTGARHAATGDPARPAMNAFPGRNAQHRTCSGHETASGRSERLDDLSGTQERRKEFEISALAQPEQSGSKSLVKNQSGALGLLGNTPRKTESAENAKTSPQTGVTAGETATSSHSCVPAFLRDSGVPA